MRRFAALAAVSMLVASIALMGIAGPASAAPRPEAVTISSVMLIVGDLSPGSFTRTSGSTRICESGDVQDTRWVWGGSTPHGTPLLVDKTFTCPDGLVFVQLQIRGVYVAERFSWVILGGTGAYAGLHGHGQGWTEYGDGWVENFYTGFLVD